MIHLIALRNGTIAALGALCLSLPLVAGIAAAADIVPTQKLQAEVTTIATGLENPWSVEVLPDGAYIVTERPGRLRIIRDGQTGDPITGLPDLYTGGQGGLLDIALDPAFAKTRKLYFTASVPGKGGQGTALFSAVLSADEKQLTDVNRLFAMNRFTGTGQHFGSRIAIAADGSLYFGIGERGEMERAQDPQDHAGSILHINADGSIPAGNPFADGAGGLAEIWSIGHRNPQGIVIDPSTSQLLVVEHGARGGDEINAPEPGRNYGWPTISYGRHYSGSEIGMGKAAEGFEQPLYYWDPSIAPGAIQVYQGEMFPEWEGNLLVGALKYKLLARLERNDSGSVIHEERLFDGDYGRIRDIKVAPDGAILMLTDEENGALLRVSRATAS
ncbi:MAG: PQQ-dependent sugar dehydrogenase [Allorhizobium sp.]